MLILSSGVGSNATNHPHDVAAIQAALINLRPSPQRSSAATWRGRVDGRNSRDLESAIAALQTAAGHQPTGRIDPNGPTVAWIGNNLAQDVGTVRGLAGTALAFACRPNGVPSRQQRRDAAERRSPVPSDMGRGLGRLVDSADAALGLPVAPEAFSIDAQGRFTATLTCPGVRWFDQHGKLPPVGSAPNTKPPAEALRMLHRVSAGIGEVSEGGPGDAVVTSRAALTCLRDPSLRLDTAQASRLGITTTGDACVDKLIAAALRIIDSGRDTRELPVLLDALDRADPAAKRSLDALVKKIRTVDGDIPGTAPTAPNTGMPPGSGRFDPACFYDLERPRDGLPSRAVERLCGFIERSGDVTGRHARDIETICGILDTSQPTLARQMRERVRVLNGPMTPEKLKYLRRPTLDEIRAVASPPVLLLTEGPGRATPADFDRAAPSLATRPIDPAKRDQIILPDGVSREMTAGATIDVPEDDPTTLELIGQCATEHYGFTIGFGGPGGTMAIAGAPLLSKDGKILGKASKRTSIASKTARELFPKKLPRPLPAPTLAAPNAVARTYGALIGRWIPWVGWVLLAADLAIISFCVSTAKRRQNERNK